MAELAAPRVVVPYTVLREETVAALAACGIEAERVPVHDPFAYSRLLCHLWEDGRTFVVIEHDIAPRPGDLEALLACDCDWCGFAYNIGTQYAACMGFTKFTSAIIARHPDAMARAAADDRDGMKPGIWVRMDVRLDNVLQPQGEKIHTHWPPVPHYNEKQLIPVEMARGWCKWPADGPV